MTEPWLEGAHASLRIASTLGPTPPPREGATLTVSLGPTHSLSLSPSFFFFHICLRDGHGGGGCIRTGLVQADQLVGTPYTPTRDLSSDGETHEPSFTEGLQAILAT